MIASLACRRCRRRCFLSSSSSFPTSHWFGRGRLPLRPDYRSRLSKCDRRLRSLHSLDSSTTINNPQCVYAGRTNSGHLNKLRMKMLLLLLIRSTPHRSPNHYAESEITLAGAADSSLLSSSGSNQKDCGY